MNVLSFDTCFNACSVAVGRIAGADATVLAHTFEAREKGHAEALFPMIEATLAEAGLTIADIGMIAVTRGPGSFTGTRTSVAAARGFALARGLPIVAASSLQVMAVGAARRLRAEHDTANTATIAVAIDARRERIYFDSFSQPLSAASPSKPELLTVSEACSATMRAQSTAAGHGVVLVGTAANAIAARLQADGDVADAAPTSAFPNLQPDAQDLITLAASGAATPEDHVAPLYLRPPDAKPQASKVLARTSASSSVSNPPRP